MRFNVVIVPFMELIDKIKIADMKETLPPSGEKNSTQLFLRSKR